MSIIAKSASEKRYLVAQEVKALYGIGYTAILTLVKDRRLRRRKVGTAWRYPVDDLEAIFSADTRCHKRHITKNKAGAFSQLPAQS